jgi:hypothetical protein
MHATDYNGRRVKLIIEVAVIGEMKIVRCCHLKGSVANVSAKFYFVCPGKQREENNVYHWSLCPELMQPTLQMAFL